MKKTIVIVYIYENWNNIKRCIISLKNYINKENPIFLIGDFCPKDLELKIKKEIEDIYNFYYKNNNKKLGFIKTCNKVINELEDKVNNIILLNSNFVLMRNSLEEMINILNKSEKNGIICPRSNRGGLLKIPLRNNLKRKININESYKIYKTVKEFMPAQQIIPFATNDIMLIKREIINNYGLFDEIFESKLEAIIDFCLRVNQYGYNVVVSNKSYVYNYEIKLNIITTNSNILFKRYNYCNKIKDFYINKVLSPFDYFADLFSNDIYIKKRILISLYELPAAYNGTAEHALCVLKEFTKLFSKKYEIYILINKEADEFFNISKNYNNVFYESNIRGTFHLAYVPFQIFEMQHLILLNHICLKFVFCMQDIISIRSYYLLKDNIDRIEVFKKSIRYSNAITFISNFVLNDTKNYFFEEFDRRNILTKVIYLASNRKPLLISNKDYKKIFKQYFIIFGNSYKHKLLQETIIVLKKSKYNFIIIGTNNNGYIGSNIYGYKSGYLEDNFIDYLLLNSLGVVFPSVYEGFGLPIFHSLNFNKKIIVYENQLNKELQNYLIDFKNYIYMFKKLTEIENLLDIIYYSPNIKYINYKFRTWEDVTREIEEVINKVLNENINIDLINERWKNINYIESLKLEHLISESNYDRLKIIIKTKYPNIYEILKKLKHYNKIKK